MRKRCNTKTKKTDEELTKTFWDAPMAALFMDQVIAPVVGKTVKTLQMDRWRGLGIPYRKCSGRILYQKSDVISWIESHQLVSSTSQNKSNGDDCNDA